jgi:hypothetical protein
MVGRGRKTTILPTLVEERYRDGRGEGEGDWKRDDERRGRDVERDPRGGQGGKFVMEKPMTGRGFRI